VSNDIEIVVRGRDDSATAFASADAKAKKFKADLARTIDELNAKKLKIDADVVAAEQKLARLREQAKTATGDVKVKVDADIAAGEAKLKVMHAQAKDLDGEVVRLRVEVDKTGADGGLHQLGEDAAKSGMESSASFSRNFKAGLMPGLIITGAVLAGPLTAAVAGAITAGGVAGMAGLGGYLQKDNPVVADAGASLGRVFVNGLRRASAGMAGPLAAGMNILKAGFVRDLPQIRAAFDAVAGAVAPLARALAETAHNALPGFVAMLEKSGPVIDAVAENLPMLGAELGNLFATFADIAPEAGQAIEDLLVVIMGLVEAFRRLSLAGAGTVDILHGDLAEGLDLMGRALTDGVDVTDGMAASTGKLTGEFKGLDSSTQQVKKSLQALASEMLQQRADVRGYEAAVDAASEALKENGRTLNVHTAKGRDNQAALDDIASSAMRWRESVQKAGGSTAAQNRILAQAQGQLTATGRRFGMTRAQAEAYARAVLGIPRRVDTTVVITEQYRAARRSTFSQQVPRAARAAGGIVGGPVGHAADGGIRGGLTEVAEQGRELIEVPGGAGAMALPPGSRVWSNPDSERMLAGASTGRGGGVARVELAVTGADREFAEFLRRVLRVDPGVQAAIRAAVA
jgi:hypothetical protein